MRSLEGKKEILQMERRGTRSARKHLEHQMLEIKEDSMKNHLKKEMYRSRYLHSQGTITSSCRDAQVETQDSVEDLSEDECWRSKISKKSRCIHEGYSGNIYRGHYNNEDVVVKIWNGKELDGLLDLKNEI